VRVDHGRWQEIRPTSSCRAGSFQQARMCQIPALQPSASEIKADK
jgi:hypothetical protein